MDKFFEVSPISGIWCSGSWCSIYKRILCTFIFYLFFAALICIGLFVDYDDHIENGRYTYVPEEENKGNEYIEFKLTDNGKDDSKLTYYNSIEEAILNSPLKAEHENLSAPEDFLNHVDEILHIWNGKQYLPQLNMTVKVR